MINVVTDHLSKPSLDGATLRIDRASRHLDEFERGFREFRDANIGRVVIQQGSGTPPEVFVQFEDSLSVPLHLSLPVSDCIHNLRAALDYLIYELAFLDSGTAKSGTQFPIKDSPEDFNRGRKELLRGLSDDHIRVIQSLQPYNGVDWTKTLRNISNPDKHRHLTLMKPQLGDVVYSHASGEKDDVRVMMDGEPTYIKRKDVFAVGFADGSALVINTLLKLIVEVGKTVDSFKPDFA